MFGRFLLVNSTNPGVGTEIGNKEIVVLGMSDSPPQGISGLDEAMTGLEPERVKGIL